MGMTPSKAEIVARAIHAASAFGPVTSGFRQALEDAANAAAPSGAPPASWSEVTPIGNEGVAHLLTSGALKARSCTACNRRHFALAFAPADAPCRTCSDKVTPAPQPSTTLPGGRRASPLFLAFMVATR